MIESSGEIESVMSQSHGMDSSSPVEALAGREVLVVGLGLTGRSVARFLSRRGASVSVVDSRDEGLLAGAEDLRKMGVKVKAGGLRSGDFEDAELIVLSPGFPASDPLLKQARARGVEVIGGLELASRFITVPIIAIAGTNGKSTVTSLIGSVLEAAGVSVFVGGNIGTPAVDYFLDESQAKICVLEVSSFQLESIVTFRPHVAILLNITDDHLDRYSGFEEYAAVKFRLFDNQQRRDFAVVNAADALIHDETLDVEASSHGEAIRVPFNCSSDDDNGLCIRGTDVLYRKDGLVEEYPLEGTSLTGLHNMENAMAAIAALRLCGVSSGDVQEGLRSFHGLRYRMELVRERGGVRFINDSKGTNTGALMMALRSTAAPVILIAGGRDKGGDYTALREIMADKVRLLIVLGEGAGRLRESFSDIVDVQAVSTMEEAVEAAAKEAAAGDTVLLSPACSSFDMFRDFKERGARFTALVKALS